MELEQFIFNLDFTSVMWQVIGTLIFILGDIIIGFISACIRHEVDSQKMREGLLRKMILIIIMTLSFVCQYAFWNLSIISKVVCLYIVFMEIISILENIRKAGIDIGKLGELLKIKEEEK